MFTVTSSVFIQFGHHVRGHAGPCISIHGHTWRFELTAGAEELDPHGFVIDFDLLQEQVLEPCHRLLDHGFAVGAETWVDIREGLVPIGERLVASREPFQGNRGARQPGFEGELNGARNEWPGGIKVAVFPFTPTSERLAQWLYEVGREAVARPELGGGRVSIACARVYETMHPTEFMAEYRP